MQIRHIIYKSSNKHVALLHKYIYSKRLLNSG